MVKALCPCAKHQPPHKMEDFALNLKFQGSAWEGERLKQPCLFPLISIYLAGIPIKASYLLGLPFLAVANKRI